MVMTFPNGDLMARLRVVSASFRLQPTQEIRRQASGAWQVRDLGPSLWHARVTSICKTFREQAEVQALIDALQGAIQPLHVYDPFKAFPAADPAGTILGAATPSIHTLNADNKRMRIQGLPAGYRLFPGDLLAFDYGSSRALHRVVEVDGAVADGGGITPLFEVRPHIRSGAAPGAAVLLAKPAAVMRLVPGSVSIEASASSRMVSFDAVQTL